MTEYRLACTCPQCGELIIGSSVLDMASPEGVVDLNNFCCESFHCDNCGTSVYTPGEIDSMAEVDYREDYQDDDDYEEDEE